MVAFQPQTTCCCDASMTWQGLVQMMSRELCDPVIGVRSAAWYPYWRLPWLRNVHVDDTKLDTCQITRKIITRSKCQSWWRPCHSSFAVLFYSPLFCSMNSEVRWDEVRCVNVSDVVSQCLSGKNWSESSPVRGLITGRVRIMRTITPGSTQTLISCKSSAGTFIFPPNIWSDWGCHPDWWRLSISLTKMSKLSRSFHYYIGLLTQFCRTAK